MATGRFLTVPQAAERLACSRDRVYDLVSAGLLARRGGMKGTRLRIAESDLQRCIDSTKTAPLRPAGVEARLPASPKA